MNSTIGIKWLENYIRGGNNIDVLNVQRNLIDLCYWTKSILDRTETFPYDTKTCSNNLFKYPHNVPNIMYQNSLCTSFHVVYSFRLTIVSPVRINILWKESYLQAWNISVDTSPKEHIRSSIGYETIRQRHEFQKV